MQLSNLKNFFTNSTPSNDYQRYQKALETHNHYKKVAGKEYYIHWTLDDAIYCLLDRFGTTSDKKDAWKAKTQHTVVSLAEYQNMLQHISMMLEENDDIPHEVSKAFVYFVNTKRNIPQTEIYADQKTNNNPPLYEVLRNVCHASFDISGGSLKPIHDTYEHTKTQAHALIERYIRHLESTRQSSARKTLAKIAIFAGACFLGKAYENTHEYTIYTHTLRGPHIPESMNGWAIINLSDIHIHENNISNVDEKTLFPAYFKRLSQEIYQAGVSHEKTILVLPGDFVSQAAFWFEQSDRKYVESILPSLNLLPGAHRYVTFGNHDEIHSYTDELRAWFKDNGYTILDDPQSPMTIDKTTFAEHNVAVMGIPDFIERQWDHTPQNIQTIIDATQEAAFSILLVHNLDSIDPHLEKLRNTYIATGHTHWFHINLPLIKDLINRAQLHFNSAYYADRYDLKNRVHIDNCPGLNNSPSIPFRMKATPGAKVTFLHHESSKK